MDSDLDKCKKLKIIGVTLIVSGIVLIVAAFAAAPFTGAISIAAALPGIVIAVIGLGKLGDADDIKNKSLQKEQPTSSDDTEEKAQFISVDISHTHRNKVSYTANIKSSCVNFFNKKKNAEEIKTRADQDVDDATLKLGR